MKRASISTKMIVLLIFTSVMTLLINVMMFLNINQVLVQIEQVYATNVQLNKMTEELDKVHSEMLEYLKTRDSGVLQEYYISQQNLSEQLAMVQEEAMDRQTSVLKNNIYYLGKNYLKISEEAVKAKRGRDVNTYGERYEDAGKMKEYLNGYISSLNNIQFQGNSHNYLLFAKFPILYGSSRNDYVLRRCTVRYDHGRYDDAASHETVENFVEAREGSYSGGSFRGHPGISYRR